MDSYDLGEITSIYFEDRDFTNFDTLQDVEYFDCFRLSNDSKFIVASYTFDHTHKDFVKSCDLLKKKDETIYEYSLDGFQCTVTTLLPYKEYHLNPLIEQQEANTNLLANIHLLGTGISKLFITPLEEEDNSKNPSTIPPAKYSSKRRRLINKTTCDENYHQKQMQYRIDFLNVVQSIGEGHSSIPTEQQLVNFWKNPLKPTKPPKVNYLDILLSELDPKVAKAWGAQPSTRSDRLIDLPIEDYNKLFEPPRSKKGNVEALFDLEDNEYFELFVPSKKEEDVIVKASYKSTEPTESDSMQITREPIPPYKETHEYVSDDDEKVLIEFSTDDEEDCVIRLSHVSIEDSHETDTKNFVLVPTKEEELQQEEGCREIWQVDVSVDQCRQLSGDDDIKTQSSTSVDKDSDYVAIFTNN